MLRTIKAAAICSMLAAWAIMNICFMVYMCASGYWYYTPIGFFLILAPAFFVIDRMYSKLLDKV